MKRVKEACLCQTLHFATKEPLDPDCTAKLVKAEVEMYKNTLDRKKVKYKIISEESQADGSVILKIIRQNVNYPVGHYLD